MIHWILDGPRLLTFCGLALVLLLQSDPARAAPLSAEDAVRLALERSPHVKFSEQALAAAQAEERSALAARLPRLDFEESYLRTDQPVASFGSLLNQGRFSAGLLDPVRDPSLSALNHPDSLDNFRTRFTVKQPLFAGGSLHYGQKINQRESAAVAEELSASRSEVAFRALEAYWGLALARENLEVARRAVTAAEESLRQIELLFKEGTVVRSDLLSGKVLLADFRDQLVRAGGEARVAERALHILVGEAGDGGWEVAALSPPGSEDFPELNPHGLLGLAKQRRPEYAALRARSEAAQMGVRAARGGLLPSMGVEAGYEWNAPRFAGDLQGSYLLGLGLNWNLFNGFGDWARVQEARARGEMLRFALRRFEERMLMEIEEATVAVATGRESLDVTRERVGLAEESLRIIRQRYREGLTTLVELEQAELALSRSQLAWSRAVHDLRLALARLRLVTGEPPAREPRPEGGEG